MSTKILVVDDNIELCENLRDILELDGYDIITVNDGLEAVDLVRREEPRLVLLDVRLPRLDGFGVYRRIREAGSQAAVIMMTAYAIDEHITDALKEGVLDVLKKPLDFEVLIKLVAASLDPLEIPLQKEQEGRCGRVL